MQARALLAAMVIVLGCGREGGPAQLDVEMLSVSGAVGGTTLDGVTSGTASGEREGEQGTFFVEGPDLTMQLSACPLGNLDTDPYGLGGGGTRPGSGPIPVPEDAGLGMEVQSGTVTGVDCFGRGLTVCAAGGCGQFTSDEVELSIVEENGWRRVTADASGGGGALRVELRYRETH
jgi:hypothetical protein